MANIPAAVQAKMVPNWRDAHTWWSVRVNFIGALFSAIGFGIQIALGETTLFAFAPNKMVWIIMFVTCVSAIIGRLTLQDKD